MTVHKAVQCRAVLRQATALLPPVQMTCHISRVSVEILSVNRLNVFYRIRYFKPDLVRPSTPSAEPGTGSGGLRHGEFFDVTAESSNAQWRTKTDEQGGGSTSATSQARSSRLHVQFGERKSA